MPLSRISQCFLTVAMLLLALIAAAGSASAQIADDSPVAAALKKADYAVEQIVAVSSDQRTFANSVGAIDDLIVRLRLETEFLQFMAYVSTDAELRDKGQRAEEDVRNWMIGLSKREDLYRVVKELADTEPELEGEQARLLEHTLRDFRRAGMELSAEDREKLKTLQTELTKLEIEFERNIREDETVVPLTREELAGMPDDWLAQQTKSGELFLVGMEYPSFLPLMDYCESETTRQKVWTAYKRRGGQKNVRLLERVLKLRAETAGLLGYDHYADYGTEILMSKSAREVLAFLEKLRPIARAKAKVDFDEFTAAKREHTGDAQAVLRPWDQSFYEKRLMKTRYAVDAEKIREYFPLDQVLDGLFEITQSLYQVTYNDVTDQAAERAHPVWHPDVRLYEVIDQRSGELLGLFYLDLFPRPAKYNHAAQWGLYPRKVWSDGNVQKPLAALVCNFTKPTDDKPSLLSHEEVETFFHEFGHCLHSILTEAGYGEFSGTNVARDFVEAPSQMFENWVWDAKVLAKFAKHYETGAPFPDELLKGMLQARFLASGMKAEHQIYYALVDLTYHMDPEGDVDTTEVQDKLFGEIELYEPVPETYFQASFGHLMGYEAGYYGYLWSLVYAQDMFQRFEELGLLDPEAGLYYRDKVLARGGTVDEMDMLKDYLGREPKLEPFLRHLGLTLPEGVTEP